MLLALGQTQQYTITAVSTTTPDKDSEIPSRHKGAVGIKEAMRSASFKKRLNRHRRSFKM